MSKKTFDCVAMKHEIQRRLRQQYEGVSWTERNRIIREAVKSDAHLRRLLKASH